MAGDPQVTSKLLDGYKNGDMTYKVHLDGYNLVPYLTGEVANSPRLSFFYINDDQQLVGLRYDNWQLVFLEQRAPGTLLVWANQTLEAMTGGRPMDVVFDAVGGDISPIALRATPGGRLRRGKDSDVTVEHRTA
jgi:hypothetical protein